MNKNPGVELFTGPLTVQAGGNILPFSLFKLSASEGSNIVADFRGWKCDFDRGFQAYCHMLAKRLAEAGEVMDIDVVDHIIITDKNYLSLKREGLF